MPKEKAPSAYEGLSSEMPPILAAFFFFASIALATQRIGHASPTPEPIPPGARPSCFTPFDYHNVSHAVGLCTNLLEIFVESFGEQMNTSLRWTGNNSEITHPGIVHLPQVVRAHDRTAGCLLEIVDRGNGDSFEPSSLMEHGTAILKDCFLKKDDCGDVALPPHYTTALAICAREETNETMVRVWGRERGRRWPLLGLPFVEYASNEAMDR